MLRGLHVPVIHILSITWARTWKWMIVYWRHFWAIRLPRQLLFRYGFAKHQVTPFHLPTRDGEILYAWHILPLDQYVRHEAAILQEARPPNAVVPDLTQTTAFKLLTSNHPSPARVVVSFHGNAGHVAQGQRAATNRYMATQPNTHVFTVE